ncbi:MAG: TraR/DksA family transcriptional regulator, partial [Pseudomonadota bacterium]
MSIDTRTLVARIEAEIAELTAAERASAGARQTVELDQQSVGRLSRMDALQVQALALAES